MCTKSEEKILMVYLKLCADTTPLLYQLINCYFLCSWTRTLHGNLHFARQFRCFARQLSFSNENFTMKKSKTSKTKMITFLPWYSKVKTVLTPKFDKNCDLCNAKCKLPCKSPGSAAVRNVVYTLSIIR